MSDIQAENAQLTADYEAACAAELAARSTDDHPAAVSARAATNDALLTHRRYWREIGEAVGVFVDRAADGARIEPVRVHNNTEG